MKDLFWIFVFFLLIIYFFGDKNTDTNIITELTETDSLETEVNQSKLLKYPFDYVVVRALGETQEYRLKDACQHIEEYFGCDCFIESGEYIQDFMKIDNTDDYLNCDSSLNYLWKEYSNSTYRTIFITDKMLWSNGAKMRGMAYYGESVILVCAKDEFLRETLLHEMGHTLNLSHCQDLTCIMSINNDEWDSGDFCQKCKNILIQNWQ